MGISRKKMINKIIIINRKCPFRLIIIITVIRKPIQMLKSRLRM